MPFSAVSVDRIDTWLPQTQCTRCGFPHCRAYAEALAAGKTDINRCPPGGDVTLRALARILNVTTKPLDPACGAPVPRTRAVIDEVRCIGCRKCLEVCPVDAIVGTHKKMHTVLDVECNGCGLCLPPCPVDCIVMVPRPGSGRDPGGLVRSHGSDSDPVIDRWRDYTRSETEHWRRRAAARRARLEHRPSRNAARRGSIFPDRGTIRRDIAAALERARRKHEGRRR